MVTNQVKSDCSSDDNNKLTDNDVNIITQELSCFVDVLSSDLKREQKTKTLVLQLNYFDTLLNLCYAFVEKAETGVLKGRCFYKSLAIFVHDYKYQDMLGVLTDLQMNSEAKKITMKCTSLIQRIEDISKIIDSMGKDELMDVDETPKKNTFQSTRN